MIKVVMKLSTSDAKKRSKALKMAAGFAGVASVSLDKDRLIVVGEGIDSVEITAVLRKKMAPVSIDLLRVGPYWKDDEITWWSAPSPPPSPPSPIRYNYPYEAPVQPYFHPYPYKAPVRSADEENCSIM